jgi:toxin-antitoxin system PIN domain toxin
MLLPDVNIWLALTFDSHVHQPAAKTWFDALTDEVCFFCRMTQQGFLRLATNRHVFGMSALTLSEAWEKYDVYGSDPRVSFADEPANIEPTWRDYTERRVFSPKVWNDAYLAAFARTAGLELVTFDKGFAQYESLNCTILS